MNLPWSAAAGGALIGAAAVLLLATIGRVAGISGITAGSLRAGKGERAWRWAFLAGLTASAGCCGGNRCPGHRRVRCCVMRCRHGS